MAKPLQIKINKTVGVVSDICWVCDQDIKTMIKKGGKFCSEKCEKEYKRDNL